MSGVTISLLKTNLTSKERIFCMLAYTPKATVQAAIGAIPLSMGLSCELIREIKYHLIFDIISSPQTNTPKEKVRK